MSPKINYSIVIPVYGTDRSLTELSERIKKVFENLEETYEIIFVDDDSPNPETWKTLKTISQSTTQVKAIKLARNFGKPGAILCGFMKSSGRYIITMDDDLQHLPEDIPNLIRHEEHDVVVGRFSNKNHSFFKRFTSRLKSWFDYKLTKKPKNVVMGPFKLIKRRIVSNMLNIKTPHPFISSHILYFTRDIVNVDVKHASRPYEDSLFSPNRRLKQFSNLLINQSSFLLNLTAILGVLMSFSSFIGVLFLLWNKFVLEKSSVSGWTSTMIVLLLSSGLILFSVGIIGQYLIRIIHLTEIRPPFAISEESEYNKNL